MKIIPLFLILLGTGIFPTRVFSQDKDLDSLLNFDLEELMGVRVVTASKTLQKQSEVPATVRVITKKQIRENGYFTLEEALSDLPGTQFRNMLSINSYTFIRGVPSQNNLILMLVDGIQINELNSGAYYGGMHYNLSNVERIEVVYGPASALYGTNAISGIINIITKDPKENKGFDINALYGSFKTIHANANYGFYYDEKDFGFRVSGMYKSSEKADLVDEKGDSNWTGNLENFENDYCFDTKITFKEFTHGAVFQYKQSSASTYNKAIGTVYCDSGSIWNIMFLNTYLKHTLDKFSKWSLSSQIYYRIATVLDNSVLYVVDTAQIGYYRPNNLIGFESMFNYTPKEKFNLIAGVVIESENLAEGFSKTWSNSPYEKPTEPPKPEMNRNNLLSIYLQAQYLFFKQLQITGGARFDNSSVYDQVITPRAALVFNRDRITSKLLYTQAFRAPKPWDYNWGSGNPDLEPEEMISIELSFGYAFTDNIRVDMSVYKNMLTELLVKEIIDDTNTKWVNSNEQLDTEGFETSLQYKKGRVKSYLNYTFNSSHFTGDEQFKTFFYDNDAEQIPEIAKHSANMGISFAFTDKIKLGLRGNYLGSRKNPKVIPSTGSEYIDDSFILHSNLSFNTIENFNFHIIVKNILDEEYYLSSNRTVTRYRQPQRTIMLKLEYDLR